jgi:shikimate kinase
MKHIDLDQEISRGEGADIRTLFHRLGEADFRKVEQSYLQKAFTQGPGLIVSTGGGTPCYEDNMAQMLQHGLVIYLQVPESELFARLRNSRQRRPLLEGYTGEALEARINELFQLREPFYRRASMTADPRYLTAEILQQMLANTQKP